MFQTTLSDLLAHYLWLMVALVGLIWLAGEWNRLRRWRRERRHEVVCRLCARMFHDESAEKLVTCPGCHALNERRRPRSI